MFISSEAIVQNIAVHRIVDDNLILSDDFNQMNGKVAKSLVKFLFKPFIKDERFHFSKMTENVVFQNAFNAFQNPDDLFEVSIQLAKRLFQLKDEDNSDGDLVTCLFEDCVIDDEVTDALGIFYLDKKQPFLQIEDENSSPQISLNIGQSKISKGAMIFNTDAENGYQALVINKAKSGETDPIWSAFLGADKIKDNYFQTQNLIHDIQEFAQKSFDSEESSEKIALINESIDFIKQNDFFEKDDFQEQVLHSPELIEKFEQFTQEKTIEKPDVKLDHFEISKPAVRTSKRFIRSVIKLDKNFHVYVHGNRENIQKGFDEDKNKHFYTLFYEEEN